MSINTLEATTPVENKAIVPSTETDKKTIEASIAPMPVASPPVKAPVAVAPKPVSVTHLPVPKLKVSSSASQRLADLEAQI